MKRRNLLIVVLGIGFLIAMTFVATLADEITPRHPTPAVQTAQAGPYQITLQVTPNPPRITTPAQLTLSIERTATRQLVPHAHVTLESTMPSMQMGSDQADAQAQDDGRYLATVQFSMSGSWQVQVIVTLPDKQTISATFQITAQ